MGLLVKRALQLHYEAEDIPEVSHSLCTYVNIIYVMEFESLIGRFILDKNQKPIVLNLCAMSC